MLNQSPLQVVQTQLKAVYERSCRKTDAKVPRTRWVKDE